MVLPPNLIILDVGSHKLEELQTLLCPMPRQLGIYLIWLIKQLVKCIIGRNKILRSEFGKHFSVIYYYFLSRRKYDLSIISIEPNSTVALPYILKLSKRYRITYIPAAVLGHDAQVVSDLKVLYTYGDSISHSIYKKNQIINAEQKNICIALKLTLIWNGLLRAGLVTNNSEVILRMNCEGAELGVLKDCLEAGIKVKALIGSIGDVEKIHGQEFECATQEVIEKLGVKYHYFKGDDPSTWHEISYIWDAYTRSYRM